MELSDGVVAVILLILLLGQLGVIYVVWGLVQIAKAHNKELTRHQEKFENLGRDLTRLWIRP